MRYTLLLFILIPLSNIAEVYKWEENGKVHYSDRPENRKSAKKLKLPAVSDYKSPKLPQVVLPGKRQSSTQDFYKLIIVHPISDQVVNEQTGVVEVEFSVKPGMAVHAGHKIEYQIGSRKVYTVNLKNSLSNVDRGSHQLQARIVDNQGIALSPTISMPFHVRRESSMIKKNLKKNGNLAPQFK